MLFQRSTIMADIDAIKTDWSADEFYAAGKATADLLTVAVGPVTVAPELEFANYSLDLLALPELAAGFVYGMVGDNHLAEMETCYASTTELGGYLEAALKDVEGFHIFAALKQFEEFVYHF